MKSPPDIRVPPPLSSPRNVATVASIAAIFLVLLTLSVIGIQTLSSIRGYVLGEGLWSKAQKRGVLALERYARSGDERDHRRFREEIEVTLGDRMARLELERERPDMDRVREGFLRGGLPEESIDGMAVLFRRFRNVAFVDRAIDIWSRGDERIDDLADLGERLRRERTSGSPDPERMDALLTSIAEVDEELTRLEGAFSRTLNEGAYQVERLLLFVLIVIAVVLVASGVLAALAMLRQVRARERALQTSEARYRTLFEENVVGVVVSSVSGTIVEANRAFARTLGFDRPEELVGTPSGAVFAHPADRITILDKIRESGVTLMEELEFRRKDGSTAWVMGSSVLLRSPDGDGEDRVLSTCIDITGRKRLENRLARTDRMEAMGQLAGGIAHDFNNLLTAIRGNAELLESELDDQPAGGPVRESLQELLGSTATAAGLARQLLAFSRGDPSEQQVLDLGELVGRIDALLVRLLPDNVELEVSAEEGRLWLEASPAQLEQVVMNLVINARDAMPEGGRLEVEAAAVHVRDRQEAEALDLEPGEYARLRVSDTGTGIPPDVRRRIFEPFFSTKESEGGTGMGLAIAYGIVAQAGGAVTVDSRLGRGSTFDVYLPTTDRRTSSGRSGPGSSTERRERGTILVVEDDDAVRSVTRRILETGGYRVVVAADGDEALQLVGSMDATTEPHLLLTDVVMPGMDGGALAAEIRKDRPEIPVLFVSGYADEKLELDYLERPDTTFLAKPYSPHVLLDTVRSLMTAGH